MNLGCLKGKLLEINLLKYNQKKAVDISNQKRYICLIKR